MDDMKDEKSVEARFARAREPGVPEIYANGFAIGLSGADGWIVLERNGDPVALLNLSFTLAKTMALALGTAVSNFEQIADQQLLTTHDVDRLFKELAAKESENDTLLQ